MFYLNYLHLRIMKKISFNGMTFSVPEILIISDIQTLCFDQHEQVEIEGTNKHQRAVARAFFNAVLDVYGPGCMEVKFGDIQLSGMMVKSPDDIFWDIQLHEVSHKNCEIDWDYTHGHSTRCSNSQFPILYVLGYKNSDAGFEDHWSLLEQQIRLFKDTPYGPDVDAVFVDDTGREPMSRKAIRGEWRRCPRCFEDETVDFSNKLRQRWPHSYDLLKCPEQLCGVPVVKFSSTDGLTALLRKDPVFKSVH